MKVLGRAGNGYIMEVSARELANVCGFGYEGAPEYLNLLRTCGALCDGSLYQGAKIPVGDWWAHLAKIRQYESAIRCEAGKLRNLTELLEQPLEFISAPAKEE